MNISKRSVVITGVVGTSALVAVGLTFGNVNSAVMRAGDELLSSTTVKLSAILAFIGAGFYLLINKDGLKRKVTEYGEVSFVVCNGKPRRYKRGSRKGELKVRWAGQGKNVIPKLRDQVTVSWLPDVLLIPKADGMYKGRRIMYDVSIEYSLPEPTNPEDYDTLENLHNVAFGFRDRNRYNEGEGTFEAHLKNRVLEATARRLPFFEADNELPSIDPDQVDWLQLVKLNGVNLATLRVSLLNLHFPSQVEFR